ncbi:isochorismatase family protein [Dyella amyloliquefaciens]|uniref:isochorismatase family protein n=1 Tax=Dyella amyloliquefaciens TaxID=1770545 RepID=UPI00102EC238|nr:isochorismatase family protein [Dyella amyloliquefaciens]
MATIRTGNKCALLVLDMQEGILANAWRRESVIAHVAQLVVQARESGAPVVWIQHHDEELARDSDAWQWVRELQPSPEERTFHKSANSAFEQTDLDAELGRLDISHIVLAGAMSNWCIRATAHGALDRGYDLTLVKDAHTTEDLKLAEDRVLAARDIVDELNTAIHWLAYPGRSNTSKATSAIDFGKLALPQAS